MFLAFPLSCWIPSFQSIANFRTALAKCIPGHCNPCWNGNKDLKFGNFTPKTTLLLTHSWPLLACDINHVDAFFGPLVLVPSFRARNLSSGWANCTQCPNWVPNWTSDNWDFHTFQWSYRQLPIFEYRCDWNQNRRLKSSVLPRNLHLPGTQYIVSALRAL